MQNNSPNNNPSDTEKTIKAGIVKIRGFLATYRILSYLPILVIVLWLGHNHPVSPDTLINLGYHVFAFIMTLVLWGALAFITTTIVLKMFRRPPIWIMLGLVVGTLLVVTLGRFQIDNHLRQSVGIDRPMIEDFEGDSFR